jgi:hypothetical protein
MGLGKEPKPTHQEYRFGQVARAMLPAWAHERPMYGHYTIHYASAQCTPIVVCPVGVGHAPQCPCGLGLSRPNPECLGPCRMYGSTFTLPKPNNHQEIFLRPHTGPSVFYTDPINIILRKVQLKILQW